MSWDLDRRQLPDLARGAALLGSGGGGDPYVGRLMVDRALRDGGRVHVLDVEEVPDDALVIATAMMGAPTVMNEKLPAGTEGVLALRTLEGHLGRRAAATIPMECGGINSTMPLVVAAQTGIPVVDADGMGRAFPELQMETFGVYGVSGSPLAIANEHGDATIVLAHDNEQMEWLARGITIRMGGAALIAEYAMDGATMRRVSIPGTLRLCIELGAAIRQARERHRDPLAALADAIAPTIYRGPRLLFEGKVEDVLRRTTEGFTKGAATIRPHVAGPLLQLRFQNEHLIAESEDGRGDETPPAPVRGGLGRQVLAVVPDLICVLEAETAEPITTEGLRYGQRVQVVALTPPEIMRTPEALRVWGPAAFGLECDYQPAVPA
ncbi:MAG: DUF917 domain-containing protein [Candidatus Dormiibacterota bacterium]